MAMAVLAACITFLLSAEGVLRQPMLYLSFHFKHHRSEYYRLLQEVRETGVWEDWLRFFLQGIVQTSEAATHAARSLLSLFEKHRTLIAGEAASVLRLHQHPVTTATSAAKTLGIAHPTAARSLRALARHGIVREIADSTYRCFYTHRLPRHPQRRYHRLILIQPLGGLATAQCCPRKSTTNHRPHAKKTSHGTPCTLCSISSACAVIFTGASRLTRLVPSQVCSRRGRGASVLAGSRCCRVV